MKSLCQLFAAACVVAALGVSCAGAATLANWNTDSLTKSISENRPPDGLFFSSEYVVEEYEYDDAYCLLYDDADANMFECEIIVDLETYQLVQYHIENDRKLVGSLVLNDDYSYDGLEVFTFMPDPEFEMADASANL